MKRLRIRRCWSLVPALFWLGMQILMTGVFSSASASDEKSVEAGPPFDSVIICTPTGLKRVSLTELLAQSADTDTGSPVPTYVNVGCDWCKSFGSVSLSARTGHAVACEFERNDVVLFITDGPAPLASAAADGFDSRAPPA